MNFLRSLFGGKREEVDFISKLPLEISQMILRKLDPESLLIVPQVSRKWNHVCRSDSYLREEARKYLKQLADEEEDEDEYIWIMGNKVNDSRWRHRGCPACLVANIGMPIIKIYRIPIIKKGRTYLKSRRFFTI